MQYFRATVSRKEYMEVYVSFDDNIKLESLSTEEKIKFYNKKIRELEKNKDLLIKDFEQNVCNNDWEVDKNSLEIDTLEVTTEKEAHKYGVIKINHK